MGFLPSVQQYFSLTSKHTELDRIAFVIRRENWLDNTLAFVWSELAIKGAFMNKTENTWTMFVFCVTSTFKTPVQNI